MKILIINNNTKHLPDLSKSLTGHSLEVRNYQPGLDFSCVDKDLIILTGGGGEGLEIDDEHKPGKLWYEDEMEFIRTTCKPIIGICMGFEVICRAYGAQVKPLDKIIEGFIKIQPNQRGRKYFGKPDIKQFEAHEWSVDSVPGEQLEVLASSKTGIEIVKHKTKRIIATQFHPEKGGTLKLEALIRALS